MKTFKKLKDLTPEEEFQLKCVQEYSKHHGRPRTRREFLASGAMWGAASLVLPSALSLISDMAQAQVAPAVNMPGFVAINLSGGASLAGNVAALDAAGNLLPSYAPVGLGTQANLVATLRSPFGVAGPSFAGISQVMAGINGVTTQATRDRTSMLLMCVSSNDDTANNMFDPTPMISKAKSRAGAFLPPLGDNRNQPAVLPAVPALRVNNLDDIQNAIGIKGSIESLSAAQKQRIMRTVARLSEAQKVNLAGKSGADLLGSLVDSANQKNVALIGDTGGALNPNNIQGINNVWNLNDNGESRDAAIVYNTINGNSVAGYLEMGGYDYHGQGRNTQDTRDTGAGRKIGQILETAALMNEKVCIVVTSDGSVGHALSATPGAAATGDRGTHGMSYMFFFDPAVRPTQTASQVGSFRVAGTDRIGVNEATAIGGSPQLATAAMVANYLAFAKRLELFNSAAPRTFDSQVLANEIIKIA